MNKTVKQLIFAVSLPCFNLLLTNTMVSAKGTGLIFVSNEKGNTLSVLDSKTNQVINTIETCGRPRGMHFNLDKTLFISNFLGSNVRFQQNWRTRPPCTKISGFQIYESVV